MKKIFTSLVVAIGLAACGGGGGSGDGDITVPPPPPPTTTVTRSFDVRDFSEVAVRNSFDVIVQEGDRYSVEITVDEQYADLVDVSREGIRLTIGFREDYSGDIRANTVRGIVTLPQLTAIEVVNSAIVTMAGFTASFLEVDLSGNSILEGPNNSVDLVTATLGGSSRLQLQDIAPLPAAHVELSGSSRATVNMMNGGTLTGSASGSSNLSYYGDNTFLDVATYNTASVTRKGGTR